MHLPEPWKSFFAEIDQALNQVVALHCLGGFVAKVLYALPRDTSDVDVLPIAPNKEVDSVLSTGFEGSALHKKYGVYLQVVGVAPIPEDYESRLIEMFSGMFTHLHLFGLDLLTTEVFTVDFNRSCRITTKTKLLIIRAHRLMKN
jgi:hypothetical protein